MKNLINVRNSVIIILCITVVCMAIGFIVISIELKKQKEIKPSFDVIFTNIRKSSSIKGSTIEPISKAEVDKNKHKVNMQFQLNSAHDELIYIATIKNIGTLPANIIDIVESPNYQDEKLSKLISPVTIQLPEIENKIIQPQEEAEIKVIVYYNPSSENIKKEFNYSLSLLTKSA